ncbi:MAG TPA: hypothetical protein VFM47_03270, partial [Gaiellales bacterium]|nr:hypothetical protein [Gaiellales bacterium]
PAGSRTWGHPSMVVATAAATESGVNWVDKADEYYATVNELPGEPAAARSKPPRPLLPALAGRPDLSLVDYPETR